MTCPTCGGKWVWTRQDKIFSDNPSHRFKVNIFSCDSCTNSMVADSVRAKKEKIPQASEKPKIYRPIITEEEKKIYDKHKMSDKELSKYMKDIKKHTKKVSNAL